MKSKKTKNNKKEPLALSILKAIGVAGMVLVALSSPYGGAAVIKEIQRRSKYNEYRYKRAQFMSALWYLRKKKYVEVMGQEGTELKIKITAKGVEKMKRFDFDNLKLSKSNLWDQKWRIVIFDIPEKKKYARDVLRNKLVELGFYKLQNSVWTCPWDCIDEIVFIRKFLEIEPYVSIVLADAIDEEMKIRRKFNIDFS